MRRLLCFCLTLALVFAVSSASAVILPKEPTRYHFSIGHLALEDAAAHEGAMDIKASVQLNESALVPEIALQAVAAILGQITLEGVMQAGENGGGMDWTLMAGDQAVMEISQRKQEENVMLQLQETAVCAMDAEMENLGDLAGILAQIDYEDLMQKKQPLLALAEEQVRKIWGLASPFVEDNDYLSVSSGSTSHAVTYRIDDAAFHQIMEEWVMQLPQEIPQVLRDKLVDFAFNAELRNTMKFNLTYGEGDMLRSARGSGTIRYQGKSAGFSFSYSASASSTRITRSWRIGYEPTTGDTMVFNLSTLSSSSGSGRAAQEADLSVSGKWDGHTYRIRYTTDFLNRYEKTDEGLTELLTGNLKASLKYAGDVLLEVNAKRNGNTNHTKAQTEVAETWTGTIGRGEEILFDGSLTLEMKKSDEGLKTELNVPMAITAEDEEALEKVKEMWENSANEVRKALLNALDEETMALLLSAF